MSTDGVVRQVDSWRVLATCDHGKGYLYLTIQVNGLPKKVRLNRLVLTAFVGPRPSSIQAAHLNDVRGDNRLVNLEWKTPLANAADRSAHGSQVHGEQINTAKLTAADVAEMKRRMADGACDAELADAYGVNRRSVCKIRLGRIWSRVPSPGPIANPPGKRRHVARLTAALAGREGGAL